MHIIPTSLSITQLLSSANEQYVIPAYQRRYSWHEKQLWELIDDINLLEGSDTHLLGSIVCLTGHHQAGINRLELVDGQQRLTTLSILLHCIKERLIRDGETDKAQELERLLTARALGKPPVPKIALDSLDARDFGMLLKGQTPPKPENDRLCNAFAIVREWAADQELSDLGTFLYFLQNHAIVIRLDVGDAKDAFKLFETINNRGLRLSPTDIIKNFLLGNAARFGVDHLEVARERWASLIRNLDGVNTETFFRHFLCGLLRRRVTVSQVIGTFKKVFMEQVLEASKLPERSWYVEDDDEGEIEEEEGVEEPASTEIASVVGDDEDSAATSTGGEKVSFEDFLIDLESSARIYGQIVLCRTGVAAIDRRLRNLRMIKSLQTFGFLTVLRKGGCPDSAFIEVLKVTEAFLMRRHICRGRANENEIAFAKLCGIDCTNPLDELRDTYRKYCPSDERFREDFAGAYFGGGLVERARYCLEQLELREHGDHNEVQVAGADSVHVEHIIPQKIKTKKAKDQFGDWPSYLGPASESRHAKFVWRIGNLTLFSGALNIGASNNPYEKKKKSYKVSGIRITSNLPERYEEFRFEQVDARSEAIAVVAVVMWPMP